MTRSASNREVWDSGEGYERYVGRWSRLVARDFVRWLDVAPGSAWLDVGCGTGALIDAILEGAAPDNVSGIDRSEGYVAHARGRIADGRVELRTGDAQAVPFEDGAFDAAVSGLVLNFVPDKEVMAGEMARVVRHGGVVACYVWDYADKMELMRHFWDAAVELDQAASRLDEGQRFPICDPGRLEALFQNSGLHSVESKAIDVPTAFADFDDYWTPFLMSQGPAPGYCTSLDEAARARLRERVRSRLPIRPDGSIHLIARGWAVKGIVP